MQSRKLDQNTLPKDLKQVHISRYLQLQTLLYQFWEHGIPIRVRTYV